MLPPSRYLQFTDGARHAVGRRAVSGATAFILRRCLETHGLTKHVIMARPFHWEACLDNEGVKFSLIKGMSKSRA